MRLALCLAMLALAVAPARVSAQAFTATIPIEVLDPDPALATGELGIGGGFWAAYPIVAMQPARIARGIVIEKAVGRRTVLALAVLGQPEKTAAGTLRLDGAPDKQAWCEIPTTGWVVSAQDFTVDCYQDRDGDGALETKYRGKLHGEVAVMLASVDKPAAIKPLTYRAAEVTDLLRFDVGYKSCGSATETVAAKVTVLRFGTFVRRADTKGPSVCTDAATLLEERADGEKLYQFGRFKVAVRESEGRLLTRLVEGIPAGTLLGNLRTDRPLLDATTPVPMIDVAAKTERPPLYLVAMPQTASVVGAGENILTAEVAHGITGKLRWDTAERRGSEKEVFPAGTPVFGVPMSGSLGERALDLTMVWCVPKRDQSKTLMAKCFIPMPYGYGVMRSNRPFHIERLSHGSGSIDTPIVERGPVEFDGPLYLQVRFKRAKSDDVILETSVSYQREPVWNELRLPLEEDGTATFAVGRGVILVRPGADKKTAAIKILGEFKIGANASPTAVTLRTSSGSLH